jgi:hypothetical protein
MRNVSTDYVGIKQFCVGGQNEDWPVPDEYLPEARAVQTRLYCDIVKLPVLMLCRSAARWASLQMQIAAEAVACIAA